VEVSKQGGDAGLEIVTDIAYLLDGAVVRVGHVPIQVALTGIDRAGVTAQQQLWNRFGDLACRLRRSGELFTGEAGDKDWQESAMRAVGSRAARASATAWAIDALENLPSYV